jgi:hypothetical protein
VKQYLGKLICATKQQELVTKKSPSHRCCEALTNRPTPSALCILLMLPVPSLVGRQTDPKPVIRLEERSKKIFKSPFAIQYFRRSSDFFL